MLSLLKSRRNLRFTWFLVKISGNVALKVISVGGVAQWLGRRSVAGGLSLIYA